MMEFLGGGGVKGMGEDRCSAYRLGPIELGWVRGAHNTIFLSKC